MYLISKYFLHIFNKLLNCKYLIIYEIYRFFRNIVVLVYNLHVAVKLKKKRIMSINFNDLFYTVS
jgi:hypothetical protein